MVERPEVNLDQLYREVVMDHHRHPRGRVPLERVDAHAEGFNPVCGDEVRVALRLDGETLAGVHVEGRGCAICTASGSIMAELLPGRSLADGERTGEAFRAVLHGAGAPAGVELGDLEALEGVQRFPVRVKCALLPWVTLLEAIGSWRDNAAPRAATTEEES
jgi:nitrogen fixation NifU-like protein